MNYYQLATTGGGSSLRGVKYGEFDQSAWVTMTADGPIVANVALNGVHPDDLGPIPSEEDGRIPGKGKGLVPVRGLATLDGKPLTGAMLAFYPVKVEETGRVRASGLGRTDVDGTFEVYVNRGPAGLAPGDYVIEVGQAQPLVVPERLAEFPVPKVYQSRKTSPLRASVADGPETVLTIELRSAPGS
jgi:hypothetical protein